MDLPRKKLLAAALMVCTGCAAAQTIQISRENKTIAISTTDEATAVADLAAIHIGFELFAPDAASAYAEGAKLSQAVIGSLKKAGVEDKSIESKMQSLSRMTNFDEKATPEERASRQFHFQQAWEVTTDPKSAAATLRVAIAAGANESGEIDWRLTTRKALQGQAAAKALVKARAVASQMADGLHVKLGALIYASNQTPNTQIYFARDKSRNLETDMAEVSGVVAGAPLEIRPQTIREEATVYAVFAIE